MLRKLIKPLLFCALSANLVAVNASDLAKEKRWADQVADALIDGDAVYLNDGTSDFLTIFTENTDGDTDKAAVVIHGLGIHPDWSTVIQPLRVGLTEHGWHTLSIQMPVLPNEVEGKDYTKIFPGVPPRIDAAIAYLRDEIGAKTVVLVSHSMGAAMTSYYLSEAPRDIAGWVAIGLGPGVDDPTRDTTAQLGKITLPMLDLYGSEDLPGVVQNASARKAAQSGNKHYTQIVESGADHFFDGEESALIKHVSDWMNRFD